MKNNIITTILGIALSTAAPIWAQTTTSHAQSPKPSEVRVVETNSRELTLNLKESKSSRLKPTLQKVGKLSTNPRGRAKHDKAPVPKPLIYVEGFERI